MMPLASTWPRGQDGVCLIETRHQSDDPWRSRLLVQIALEADLLVRPITERLVRRLAAPAEPSLISFGSDLPPTLSHNLELPCDVIRTIVFGRDDNFVHTVILCLRFLPRWSSQADEAVILFVSQARSSLGDLQVAHEAASSPHSPCHYTEDRCNETILKTDRGT